MTPYYAILRAIPNKVLGVLAMVGSIFMFVLLPWLDRSPVYSIRYKGWMYKTAICLFALSFVGLGYLGLHEPTPGKVIAARIFSTVYFSFFILMPVYTKYDKTKRVPTRLT